MMLAEKDVRQLIGILSDIISFRGDLTQSRERLMNGLIELIDADAWAWSLVHMEAGHAPRQLVREVAGFTNDQLPKYLRTMEHPDMTQALGSYVQESIERAKPLTRNDTQINFVSHKDLEGVQMWFETGFRSFILCAVPLKDGTFSGIGIYRKKEKPDFTERENRITHILLSEVPWLHQREWGTETGKMLHDLSPRKREILHLLTQGKSRKEIAADLNLSVHWVNDCVKQIFAYFDVNSHAELVARITVGDGGDVA